MPFYHIPSQLITPIWDIFPENDVFQRDETDNHSLTASNKRGISIRSSDWYEQYPENKAFFMDQELADTRQFPSSCMDCVLERH